MLGVGTFRPSSLLFVLCVTTGLYAQHQEGPRAQGGSAALRVSLRLKDESPYMGAASVRLLNETGADVSGKKESDGIVVFPEVETGSYTIEAKAPGFAPVRQNIHVDGHGALTHFVVMQPKSIELPPSVPALSSPDLKSERVWWAPPGIDDAIPPVDAQVECPMEDVLNGAGQRVQQFVGDLEKFSAQERLEHHVVDALGNRRSAEIRDFTYVVTVSKTKTGVFLLDEYRNGSVAPDLFPARIATQGMPAIVLVFHPLIKPDFEFTCEGLGQWHSKPAWQMHFIQRPNRPGRILGYSVDGKFLSLPLKGRAWIGLETLQVLRIETELVRPVPELALAVEDVAISYEPVQFRSQGESLWLPREVELYVERRARRYFRRHTYKDFRLFTVETAQKFQFAKESYGFTNETDRNITGVLTVVPVESSKLHPVSLTFTIPAGGSVLKLVGPGKDVQIPVELVASATFAHDGPQNSIKVDAHLSKGTTLDVISGMPPSRP
jgi:hypothetical protein